MKGRLLEALRLLAFGFVVGYTTLVLLWFQQNLGLEERLMEHLPVRILPVFLVNAALDQMNLSGSPTCGVRIESLSSPPAHPRLPAEPEARPTPKV